MSSGLVKKSGIRNSRRTSAMLNEPSAPIPMDQTELRFSSSGRLAHAVLPNAGLLQTP